MKYENSGQLKKGTIEMLVLFFLDKEDMYGYQLRQEFKERSGGYYQIPDASLYPTLYRLVQNGYISEREEIIDRRLRRYYHLESSGKERLTETLAEYHRLQKAIKMVLSSDDSEVQGNG